MTIKSVEAAVEDVLEEAGPLSTHDRISLHWLEIAIRGFRSKYFNQPFALGIGCVTMRINLSRQVVNAGAFCFGVLGVLYVEQCRRSNRRGVFKQDLFWRFVQIGHGGRTLADNLEEIVIIAAIESQIETSAAGIPE